MTWSALLLSAIQRLPAAWSWARRHTTPVLLVVIVVLVLLLGHACGRARDAEEQAGQAAAAVQAEAKRDAERVALEASGALVAERVARVAVERRALLLEQRLGEADALVASLRKVRAKPVATIDLSTGPVLATGPAPQEAPGGADPHTPSTAGPASPPATSCLLSAGDTGDLRAVGVVWETRAGNLVPIVSAEAWRLLPTPEARILAGRLALGALAVPEPEPEKPEREVGWRWGGTGVMGRHGWMAGPAAAPPPLRLWKLQVDVAAGPVLGPNGEWAVTATVLGGIR